MKLSELTVAPVQVTVPLYLDGGVHDRLRRLTEQWQAAVSGDDFDMANRITGEISAEAKAEPVPFRFRQLPAKRMSDLLAEHEGEDDDLRPEFEPAFVEACLADPEPDGFAGFWESLNYGQQRELLNGAWQANRPVVVPFGLASSLPTLGSTPNSGTAANEASPAVSSSAGNGSKKRRSPTTKRAASRGA
jgi:hypothetical protein